MNKKLPTTENEIVESKSVINSSDVQNTRSDKKRTGIIGFFKAHCFIRIVSLVLAFALFFGAGYLTFYLTLDENARSLLFVYDNYKKHYLFANDDYTPADALADGLFDIYSDYYTAEEYDAVLKDNEGKRSGYGISFSQSNGSIYIYKVVGNSPAEHAGIESGSKVVACEVDGNALSVDDLSSFSSGLSASKQGSILKITLEKGDSEKVFSVEKSEYRESYVSFSDGVNSFGFDDSTGNAAFVVKGTSKFSLSESWCYLEFSSFGGNASGLYGSTGQFQAALDKAVELGKNKIIIDLRNNGGGFMSVLCKISAMLCKTSSVNTDMRDVQIAEYKSGKVQHFGMDESFAENADGLRYADFFERIVFLANENSASASEALIGAVLDYDRASGSDCVRVVLDASVDSEGETVYKTYGKGIMQTTYVNSGTGEAVKLTTAALYWPVSGTCIHGLGITPKTDSRVYGITSDDGIAFAQSL